MGLRDHAQKFEPADETEADTITDTINQEPITMNTETNTSNVPAQAASGAVTTPKASKFSMAAFAEYQDMFPTEAVTGLSMAVPRVKAEQGAAYVGEISLGSKIRIEIESWNYRWLLSAGLDSKDSGYKESMEYLATSYDNETVNGKDTSVNDYLAGLKAMNYNKARKSLYIDLFGFVTWTEKGGDVPEDKRELYLVQLSQTSAGNWAAFCTTQGLLRSKGIGKDSRVIEIRAEARSKGSNKYTNFSMGMA
jgi:hypothetical protein